MLNQAPGNQIREARSDLRGDDGDLSPKFEQCLDLPFGNRPAADYQTSAVLQVKVNWVVSHLCMGVSGTWISRTAFGTNILLVPLSFLPFLSKA